MCKQIGIIQINVYSPQNVCFQKKMIGERVRKINMYHLFAFFGPDFPLSTSPLISYNFQQCVVHVLRCG